MWSTREHRVTLVITSLAVVAAVAAFVVSAEAGAAEGTRRIVLLVLGGALTGTGIILAAVERLRAERARRSAEQVALEAEEELTLTLNGALAPITSYLGELSRAGSAVEREALLGQLRQAVVDAAVRLTVSGSRSTFYSLAPGGQQLDREVYAGRSTLPRESFRAGTGDGEFVLELVQRGDLVFVEDVAAHALVTPSTEGYATVIGVAVVAGSHRLGLLTVDAPHPGDLTRTDLELVRVLANLLGAGLGQR